MVGGVGTNLDISRRDGVSQVDDKLGELFHVDHVAILVLLRSDNLRAASHLKQAFE